MGIPLTGNLQPWRKGQPIEANRLNELQNRAILEVRVQNNTGLTVVRNGNLVVIGRRDGVGGNEAIKTGEIPCLTYASSGSNGSDTSAADFHYDAKDLDGSIIALDIPLSTPRPFGLMIQAADGYMGWGAYRSDGTFVLHNAGERVATIVCGS